ncbi:MAG: hypothetical protein SPI87_09425 [Anaerobutyricum sp.]|nr:hypothetical protein [Eubacterium sp.]MDY6047221.1 hypothetical protein [Anaerobutyricum sp.]
MKKMKRIFALAGVILLIGLVILTLYFAVTGSRYFMASLFCMLMVPLMMYVYMFVYRMVKGDSAGEDEDTK